MSHSLHADSLRREGARIEVIAFVVTRAPLTSLLLVKSPYEGTWMPPQEGVNIEEPFRSAFCRCLRDECGIDIPKEEDEQRKLFYLRDVEYLGTLTLPPNRHGERLVADNAIGTPFENIRLEKKAYWAAYAMIKDASKIEPVPDGCETEEAGWYGFNWARELITKTNRPEKVDLLLKGFKSCEKHLRGA